MMRQQKQDAFRRVQIGVGGIIAVLLLVGLANMAQNRATNEVPVAGSLAITDSAGTSADGAPQEPLAELGVTPSGEGASKQAPQAPQRRRP